MTWIDFIVPVGHIAILSTCAGFAAYYCGRAKRYMGEAMIFSLEAKKAAQIAITKSHVMPIRGESMAHTLMQAQMDQPQMREFKRHQEENMRNMTREPMFPREEK